MSTDTPSIHPWCDEDTDEDFDITPLLRTEFYSTPAVPSKPIHVVCRQVITTTDPITLDLKRLRPSCTKSAMSSVGKRNLKQARGSLIRMRERAAVFPQDHALRIQFLEEEIARREAFARAWESIPNADDPTGARRNLLFLTIPVYDSRHITVPSANPRREYTRGEKRRKHHTTTTMQTETRHRIVRPQPPPKRLYAPAGTTTTTTTTTETVSVEITSDDSGSHDSDM